MNVILEVENLSLTVPTGHIIQRSKRVLDDISFRIARHRATAYLGPNGAGKTSTFRILCGLVRRQSGRISFDGQTADGPLPASKVGFMPEQPYFYKHLTVRELLDALGRLSGMADTERRQSIDEWAERLDFGSVLDQRLHQCSKGQVQRVGLAQALMHHPPFLLLDEPMSGLDPIGREMVKEVLREAVRSGATLLFSSHILSDAESICEDVVILHRGRILYQGNIEELTLAADNWDIEFAGPPLPHFQGREITGQSWRVTVEGTPARDGLLRSLLADSERQLLSVSRHRHDLETAFVRLVKEDASR